MASVIIRGRQAQKERMKMAEEAAKKTPMDRLNEALGLVQTGLQIAQAGYGIKSQMQQQELNEMKIEAAKGLAQNKDIEATARSQGFATDLSIAEEADKHGTTFLKTPLQIGKQTIGTPVQKIKPGALFPTPETETVYAVNKTELDLATKQAEHDRKMDELRLTADIKKQEKLEKDTADGVRLITEEMRQSRVADAYNAFQATLELVPGGLESKEPIAGKGFLDFSRYWNQGARNLQQNFDNLVGALKLIRTGTAASDKEAANFAKEMGDTVFSTEEDFRNAMRRAQGVLRTLIATAEAKGSLKGDALNVYRSTPGVVHAGLPQLQPGYVAQTQQIPQAPQQPTAMPFEREAIAGPRLDFTTPEGRALYFGGGR